MKRDDCPSCSILASTGDSPMQKLIMKAGLCPHTSVVYKSYDIY